MRRTTGRTQASPFLSLSNEAGGGSTDLIVLREGTQKQHFHHYEIEMRKLVFQNKKTFNHDKNMIFEFNFDY
jgi:hypothetical protein